MARARATFALGALADRSHRVRGRVQQQSGEFTSALAAKDSARFWHSMRVFGAALVIAVPIYGFYYYVRDRLGIAWRRWLTHDFLHRYLSHRAFYDLTSNASIDNPDQRIAEDVNAFTQKSLTFLLEMVSAALQLSRSVACCGRSRRRWFGCSWCTP